MEASHLGQHIHHRYDKELESLRSRVLAMGGMVERQVNDAVTALAEKDEELARYVIRTDHRVNALEVDIDEDCTYILARRQPAAGDLRTVMAIIKTITDLERIGDESEKIAHMAIDCCYADTPEVSRSRLVEQITAMAQLTHKMLQAALDAFSRLDVDLAIDAARQDVEIDQHYVGLLRSLTAEIKQDPEETEQFQRLIWVARSLERIGDHARNICEYVVFLVKGKDVRHTTIEEIEEEISR